MRTFEKKVTQLRVYLIKGGSLKDRLEKTNSIIEENTWLTNSITIRQEKNQVRLILSNEPGSSEIPEEEFFSRIYYAKGHTTIIDLNNHDKHP